MGFVRQPARAIVPPTSTGPHVAAAPSALTSLGAAYALHGSQPITSGQAVVTFHYDRDLVPTGAPVGVTYSQLPGRNYKFQTPGVVPSCYDASAGTVVVQSGLGSPLYVDGLYQVVTLPATSPKTGPCPVRTGGGPTPG